MVGRSGGTLGGRERIVIVDELLAGRIKRAARRYVLRRPQTWRTSVLACALVAFAMVLPALFPPERLPTDAIVVLPLIVLAGSSVMVLLTMLHVRRHYDRELVPGRLIGLTVGTQTIRYRDHDSCTEYAYSCISGVAVMGDVVVVDLGSGFWTLPVELFDGLGLEVLRARAGRPALGHELWPELAAGLPSELAS